jgi:hypothetical protein
MVFFFMAKSQTYERISTHWHADTTASKPFYRHNLSLGRRIPLGNVHVAVGEDGMPETYDNKMVPPTVGKRNGSI